MKFGLFCAIALLIPLASAFKVNKKCSYSNIPLGGGRANERIVGGYQARVDSWPWLASLYNEWIPIRECDASIIDSQWVLTAGHCFTEGMLDSSGWTVQVGKYLESETEAYTRTFQVDKVTQSQTQQTVTNLFVHSS